MNVIVEFLAKNLRSISGLCQSCNTEGCNYLFLFVAKSAAIASSAMEAKPMLWLSSANTTKQEFETEIKYFYSYLRLGSECRIFYVLKSFSEKSKFQFCLVARGD